VSASAGAGAGNERNNGALQNGHVQNGTDDSLLYELGLARGRAEVLERELERRERADAARSRNGGLASLLRRRG
jgi:hypothetical protein